MIRTCLHHNKWWLATKFHGDSRHSSSFLCSEMTRKNAKVTPAAKTSSLQDVTPKKNSSGSGMVKSTEIRKEVTGSIFGRLCAYMFEKDDASILAVFRIFWGSIMMYEIAEHIIDDYSKTKSSFYTNMSFQNKFWGFEWVPVIEFEYMQIFLWYVIWLFSKVGNINERETTKQRVLLGIAFCVMIGFLYRLCSFLFLLGFTFIVTIEAGNYLNHFYLIQIMATYMIFLPCNCIFSVDSLIQPSIRSKTAPK